MEDKKVDKEKKKQTIKLCIAIIIFAIIIILVAAIIIRYQVEGDKNMPFNLSKIIMVSTAEGNEAEGEKKSSILIAEGEKESAILRAEANKESQIRIAEGEAEALLKLKQAEAEGIRLLKEAKADQSVLTLKSLEAVKDLANGEATKIIVPSDLQNLATLGTTIKEMMNDKK